MGRCFICEDAQKAAWFSGSDVGIPLQDVGVWSNIGLFDDVVVVARPERAKEIALSLVARGIRPAKISYMLAPLGAASLDEASPIRHLFWDDVAIGDD